MSSYLYTIGKRGRPVRFDDHDNALLTAIISIIDDRQHIRGRKPDSNAIVIAGDSGVTTISDSWTGNSYQIRDSVKVAAPRTKLDKTKVRVYHKRQPKLVQQTIPEVTATVSSNGNVTKDAPINTVAPTTTTIKSSIDITKFQEKIARLNREAAEKNLLP